jgi:hypothetical protein
LVAARGGVAPARSRHSQLAEIFGGAALQAGKQRTRNLDAGDVYFAASDGYHLLVETDHSLSLSCEGVCIFAPLDRCADGIG